MTEHEHQVFTHRYLQNLNILHFSIPNGGYRNSREGAKLKAEGVIAGVPDMMICVGKGGYNGLFIEMKKKGGRISASQKIMMENLEKEHYKCAVCFGYKEAIEVIDGYLQVER